ncbi:hypothetical protein ACQP00_22815 [Dactylosporangium sp. CS-047395]|uniref:hypothetical protein n=1 Tax=Dactylosporangium sp. CS-047395 TaxID=3239936 RepID=UPI003D8AE1BB
MSEVMIVGHELVEPCLRCDGLLRGELGQTVVGNRLAWSVSSVCDGCGTQLESCEWDALPDDYRQILLDRDGTGRLRVDPEGGRPLRLAILRTLRRYGATLAEATDTYNRLTGAGVTGTRAEVLLLANRLNATGVKTQLDP